MKHYKNEKKRGFTIIEVVLVLAIAGLIFMMIFLAWPALNRTQRDAKRRDDISLFLKKLKDYQTNNRGALPTRDVSEPTAVLDVTFDASASGITWAGFYHDYLGENFTDPNGGEYVLSIEICKKDGKLGDPCTNALSNSSEFPSKLKVFISGNCDGSDAIVSNNPRKVAVQYRMENGGLYCVNT